jgi:hypothetical protein
MIVTADGQGGEIETATVDIVQCPVTDLGGFA